MSILDDDDDLNKHLFCEKQKEKENVEGIILIWLLSKNIYLRE